MIKYSTIVPWNMSQDELLSMVSTLHTAKNWGMTHSKVLLDNGTEYNVDVNDINDYREQLLTSVGQIKL